VQYRPVFSTGVLRSLRVLRVAAGGSAETYQIFVLRNSQPQFYAVVAIYTLGSARRVPWETNIYGRCRCIKEVEKHLYRRIYRYGSSESL